ncbi:LysR family transcriptional regulator [Paracoccus jeotgali]|uniref:LysR family transcriptional regulator n=1 Tax=Paracoccus jeotgali TaxID=2065379 RepID=A0A2K9MJP7_9RHOB|nr:LysR family transcriptional regulator [Paracoccus jeotgali]AUM75833.1 LysR family transcriptional regulator [Paracoccus jeotgali]
MAIKIEMLRNFVAVAELGNLSDAAERLGRTPSAVSMSLKQLEDHLGSPLFESDRKNRLTALGRFTLIEGRREVEQFAHCVETITAFAKARVGIVRIGAVPSVTTVLLPTVVQAFMRDRPDVIIHIRDMDSATVLREVEMQRIDIGFASSRIGMSAISARHLFTDRFGVVCRADHPLRTLRRDLEWSDLQPFTLISNATGAQIDDPEFRAMDDAAFLRIRNTGSVLGMVRADVGITILPKLTIDRDADGLLFLPLAYPHTVRRVNILTRMQAELPPVARAFEQAVVDSVAERADLVLGEIQDN